MRQCAISPKSDAQKYTKNVHGAVLSAARPSMAITASEESDGFESSRYDCER
jgi:hypothetical protein